MARAVAFLAACAFAVILAAGAFSVTARAIGHGSERMRTVHGPVSRVVVDGSAGDVRLLAAAVPDVTIHEQRRYGWRAPKLDVALRGGELHVAVRCRSFSAGCSDDLDILVPQTVRRADVSVDSGNVSLAGLKGDRFQARSDSGDVQAHAIAGTVVLSSDSGDVAAAHVTGPVTLRSDSGDVHGDGLPAGLVTATSDSGDVVLR